MENLNVPNLDDCADRDRDTYQEVFAALARYAQLRTFAQSCRMMGSIERALKTEAKMQAIYDRLPPWARW